MTDGNGSSDDETPPVIPRVPSPESVLVADLALVFTALAVGCREAARKLDTLEGSEREQLVYELQREFARIGDECHEARRALRGL